MKTGNQSLFSIFNMIPRNKRIGWRCIVYTRVENHEKTAQKHWSWSFSFKTAQGQWRLPSSISHYYIEPSIIIYHRFLILGIIEYNPDSSRYQKYNNLTWTNIKFELRQLIFTGRDSIIFTRQTDLVKCKLHCHSHRSPCRLQILKFIIRPYNN